MAMVYHADTTSHFQQRLRRLGPEPAVPASEVKVYRNDRLVEIQDKDGKTIRKIRREHGR